MAVSVRLSTIESQTCVEARHAEDVAALQAAIAGDGAALKQLVAQLTPAVQTRVARALLRSPLRAGAGIRQEVQDITQDVFLALFANDARALRRWEPGLGPLTTFVGSIAHHVVVAVLRTRRRNPYHLKLQAGGTDAEDGGAPGHESSIMAKEKLSYLTRELRRRLSPQATDLFYRLFLWQEPSEKVCDATGLSRNAVYQWRSRLRAVVAMVVADWEHLEAPKLRSREGRPRAD